MRNPFLQNTRFTIVYFSSWILFAGVHFALVYFYYLNDFVTSATDSILFGLLFSILILPTWYSVRYFQPEKSKKFDIAFNHLTSFAIIMLIWIGAALLITRWIFTSDSFYYGFVIDSIPVRIIIGLFFYTIINLLYYLVIYYKNLEEKAANQARLENSLKESQLNLLRSQINPHFLFNSLNSISSLTITNPETAQELTIKFAEYLRYNLSLKENRFSTLRDEFENIKRYLDIEKSRFGDKMIHTFSFQEDCLDLEFPVMVLQPIYENAVKHGVYNSLEPVKIETFCSKTEDYIQVMVRNDFDPESPQETGTNTGISNLKQRMALLYQDDSLVQIDKKESIFEITINVPLNK